MINTIKTLVLKAAQTLHQQGLTLATAESCTGGGLSYWLTSVPGSSVWFERGFITYSNQAKIDMLGVNTETLVQYGAVSEQTACEMAEGALCHSHADQSIAITGIAGPDGGSPQNPVGTVWIAAAKRHHKAQATCYLFSGDRQAIRLCAIAKALEKIEAKNIILAPFPKG
jgi:nicotinamide-nucleotide amidase